MGCVSSTGDKEAQARTTAIDQRLAHDGAKKRNEIKLLLLGKKTKTTSNSYM